MRTILERLVEFIEAKGMSQRQFSLSLDRSPSYIFNMVKQNSIPSADLLTIISVKYPSLNIYWLLNGEGIMLISPAAGSESDNSKVDSKTIDEIVDQKIEEKFQDIKELLVELVANEIDKEIEATRKELKRKPKTSSGNA